jgi:hypothetical protein
MTILPLLQEEYYSNQSQGLRSLCNSLCQILTRSRGQEDAWQRGILMLLQRIGLSG